MSNTSYVEQEELYKLGKRLKAIRTERALSLQQLAHAVDKDRQSISRVELGKVNPSYLYLLEICKGLDMPIAELLEGL